MKVWQKLNSAFSSKPSVTFLDVTVTEESTMKKAKNRSGFTLGTIDLIMLYLGKTGTVIVGLLILPRISMMLGSEDFGLAALVLVVQALLLTLDLGLSATIGRDIAAAEANEREVLRIWRTAENAISYAYILMLILAILASMRDLLPFNPVQATMAVLIFWASTIQNIGQSALSARQRFIEVSAIQAVGAFLRGLGTLLALFLIAPTITVFLSAQLFFILCQYIFTHLRCRENLDWSAARPTEKWPNLISCSYLLWRARTLSVIGVSGAIVMQVDKVIISAFVSSSAMTPYYLASTLCLLPISILAGPIASFFQPRLVRAITVKNAVSIERHLWRMLLCIFAATLIPTWVLWVQRDSIINIWLIGSPDVRIVSEYTAILLPGICIGSLGFIPYIMLLGRGDLAFQAGQSIVLSITTLAVTAVMASLNDIHSICIVYAVYHGSSTVLSWARWCYLERHDGRRLAIRAALVTIIVLCLLLITSLVVVRYG